MESAIVGDKGSTTLGVMRNTKLENNYLFRCQDYSMTDGLYDNTRIAKGGTPLPHPLPRVRKHERIHHHINTYDDWYRLIKATGKFVGSDNKSANYHLEMGYDNLYNITSKKMTMTQTNLQFAGTLSAGHEFSYNYSTDNPMQLASVETKQYNVDGKVSDVDAKLADNQHVQSYEFDANGNMTSVSVAKKEEPKPEVENPEGQEASEEPEEKDILKSFLWDEENRLLAVNNNGSVSCYFYDAAGERTVKLTSETEMVHVNGKKVGGNDAVTKFTAYVSPYFVVSNGGAYTKHIYAASQRIASKLGNEDGFGADPRRVEMAGGKKISDIQKDNIGARYKELGFSYSAPEKEKVEKDSSMDSEAEEKLIFFYHPDHLGSTSYVTDADGNIAQHIEYIPYGEVFVEERNNSFSTNYLFNAKELDNETGLYYYGARYLDPTGAMWLSVDPLYEKNISATPYNYCLNNPVVMVDPDGRETENLVKNRRDPNAVRTPGKGYNCADDFYSAKDGGCPYAVTKLYYEKWSIDYRSKLDDYRVKSKANDNIYHAFRAMAPQQEMFFVNQEMIFTKNSFKEDLNVNELMEYMQNPNVDLIATFDIGDQWTAVNTLPYHTMLVDAIEVEYYSENRRKAGQVKNISFICYDTSTEKHFQNNDAKREKMNWNQLKALMKVEVDPVKLEMRNNIRKKNEEE